MQRYEVLVKLTDRVCYLPADHRTDRPILSAILGTQRTAMVDAGASPAHAQLFLDALHKSTGRRRDWVILTHWHWDHTFGLAHLELSSFGHHHLTRNLKRL
ncbi:MAG: MBL fold metallo-hydrolase [Anaerolineae bacterium]|nr:MBL fold metallo-hydrolase [Anaerolineae bacterium]